MVELERRKMHLPDLKMLESCINDQYLIEVESKLPMELLFISISGYLISLLLFFFPPVLIFLKKEKYEEK